MRPVLTLLVLFTVVGTTTAQDKSWVGKTIIVKKSGIKIGKTGDDGKQVYLATLTQIDYRVLGEQDGWIKVNDGRGSEGWFDKADAVVLDDAVGYFTERIRQNAKDAYAYNGRAWAWMLKGELDIAIKDYGEALRLDPGAYAYNGRGNAWSAKKEYDKAIADYNEARRLEPKEALYINNAAWLLAVASDGKVRNGKHAVELANEALGLDKKNAEYMDTLAAAYAETGDFVEAVRWQERALDDASLKNDADARRRLELYRKKQPYRQE